MLIRTLAIGARMAVHAAPSMIAAAACVWVLGGASFGRFSSNAPAEDRSPHEVASQVYISESEKGVRLVELCVDNEEDEIGHKEHPSKYIAVALPPRLPATPR